MKKIILSIEGMTCSACSNGLEKYLNKQDGIKEALVNLVMATASIEYDENVLDKEKIEIFVSKAGFKSLGEFKEIKIEKKSKKEKMKFIFFTVLFFFIIYISMGHMINMPILNILNKEINPIYYAIALFILVTSFIVYGFDIIKNGYKNLIHKTPNMDTLVGIGVLSSYIYSIYSMIMIINNQFDYLSTLYFESTASVIYFIKLGRYLDGASKDKTKEAIQKLVEITPKNAIIKKDGLEKLVTIDEISKDDIVISKPGEKIAVDGEIVSGKCHVDEAFITGESKPVRKNIGDKVIAGSINYNGYIEYKAEKIGKESTISEIVKLVVQASNTKPPIAKIADKISGYFVPVVILIAIITFIVCLIFGSSLSESLIKFVTILVVACPCSLGLATPLAIVVSEGLCAEKGILVKKGEVLEKLQKVNTIVFDKTGTLTYGKLKISKINNYSKMENEELLKIVSSLESHSSHPIGTAFKDYIKENQISKLNVENFENIPGYGIIGDINNNKIIVGNFKILEKFNIKNKYKEDENKLSKLGNSIVYVVKNNEIIGLIGVNDIIRKNTKQVIEELNKKKIATIMLTGDNKETSEKIAKEIGIKEVISNVLPSEKTEIIKRLKQENKYIIMCGDGINDSPALTTAHIGISINSGSDIAMDSSDVILTTTDLLSILNLIEISKKTIKIIKQNLFWAFFYNILMIPIAIGILSPYGIIINPMIASIAMLFSSITVIINSLRLRNL
ncbi:MAG: copper-translocating P-type ATPase [Clostridia bacterium]|nr:copper-translocating P-type ATPase [Clostridia bacterium]